MESDLDILNSALREYCRHGKSRLQKAAEYALLPEGKRCRGLLSLAIFGVFDYQKERFMKCASGIEFIHAASLIFDDLPCFDAAPIRKSKPSTYVVFGEDIAILAGLFLQEKGRHLVIENAMDNWLASASLKKTEALLNDTFTMICEGQELDIAKTKTEEELLECMEKKNSLFTLACVLPGYFLGLPEYNNQSLFKIGRNLSVAYQLFDDLRDVTETATQAGKPVGVDAHKNTLVYRHGVEWSRAYLDKLMADIESESKKIGITSVFESLIKGFMYPK
jgi:geranylgeranyl diphosphate synthase, type II